MDLWSNNHCHLVNDYSQGISSNRVNRKRNFQFLRWFYLVSSILSNICFSYLCLLYSNCCQSSMQSSSISPWWSQPQRTKTDRHLAHCCTCIFTELVTIDNILNLGEFTEISEAFPEVLFSYSNDFAINILDQLDSKSGNLRHADARIQSEGITNILQDFQPRNPTWFATSEPQTSLDFILLNSYLDQELNSFGYHW